MAARKASASEVLMVIWTLRMKARGWTFLRVGEDMVGEFGGCDG